LVHQKWLRVLGFMWNFIKKNKFNFCVFGFLLLQTQGSMAQLQVSGADKQPYDPVNLIHDVFLGSGVSVLAVKYEGENHAVGYFDHGVNQTGINRGIVMSTGRAEFAQRPNVESNFSSFSSGNKYSDADLIKALGLDPNTPEIVKDLARYEITFIPHADSLRFNYVFASEEYPKYSCSQFKDVFGFFISGPDPNGGEYQSKNIALVPGSGEVVSISTVNNGDPSTLNCIPKNGHLYNENGGSLYMTYNAYLDVFTATVKVVPCQTYTIKLALSDIADDLYDSAVFLEAKSFATNEVAVDIKTFAPDGNIAEGCQPAVISFRFNNVLDEPYDLGIKILDSHPNFILSTDQVDYTGIPANLSIPAGQKEAVFSIQPIPDPLNEGLEWIALEYQKNICQRDTLLIGIVDNKMPQVFTDELFSICKGDTIQLEASLDQAYIPPPSIVFSNHENFPITPVGDAVFSPILVEGVFPKFLKEGVIEKVCIDTAWIAGLQHFDFYLVSPKGSIMELSTANGKRSGGGNPIDSLIQTCFSPVATDNINKGNPNLSFMDPANPTYTGDYAPEGFWSDLWPDDNQDVNGLWKLMVIDNNSFVGHLESWSISFHADYQIGYNWTPVDGTLECSGCQQTDAFPGSTTNYIIEATDTYGCSTADSCLVEVLELPMVEGFACDSVSTDFLRFKWDPIPVGLGLEYSTNGSQWYAATGNQIEFTSLGFSQTITLFLRLTDGICLGSVQISSCTTLPCPAPAIMVTGISHLECFGDVDGAIAVQANGTVGPYLYELNLINNDTGVFQGLPGGTDTLFITDGNLCKVPYVFTILQPDELNMEVMTDSIMCFGQANGAIQLHTSGGNGGYLYNWSGAISATGSIDHFDNLGPGIYQIQVNDVKGCEAMATVNLVDPPKLFITAITTDVLCKSLPTGEISLFCSGGHGEYTYQWAGNSFSSTSESIRHLNGGQYHLTVTDAGNCTIDTSFTIKEPKDVLSVNVFGQDTLCNSGTSGQLSLEISGGTGPYDILWQHGADAPELFDLQPGIYSVLVTDRNGCKESERKEIVRLPPLSVGYKLLPPDCAGRPNGRILLENASYGFVGADLNDLQYEWNTLPKQFSRDAWFLKGDQTYDLKITDLFGCSYTFQIYLPDPPSMELKTLELEEVSCFGKSDGSVEIEIAGGQEPYQYYWSINATNSSGTKASELSSGYYWLTVSDAVFCTNTFSIYIPGPEAISSTATMEHIKCHGEHSGKISIDANGGVLPYFFRWNGQQGTNELAGLSAGTYLLEIADRNGCTLADSFLLRQPDFPLLVVAESFDVTCTGGSDGKISLEASGGTLPFAFSIDAKNWQTGQHFHGLPTGKFNAFVKDGNGCEYGLKDIIVENGHQLFVSLGSDTSIAFGSRLRLQPVITGDDPGPFKYQWSCSDRSILSCEDCEQPVVSPNQHTIVFLVLTNGLGCVAETNIKIDVLADRFIHVPDAFTPNHDGINDKLQVFGSPGSMVRTFKIVDYWGKKVFELHDFPVNQVDMGWDGLNKGEVMSSGIYYWFVEAKHVDLSTTTHEGSVLLIK